jgi:hypothetical protein
VVCFPLSAKRCLNKDFKQKTSVFILIAFGLCIYSYNLKVTNVENHNRQCVTSDDWLYFTSIMVIFHVILVMLVPFFIILVTNTLIFFKLTRSYSFFPKKAISKSESQKLFLKKTLYEKRTIRLDINGKYSLKKPEIIPMKTYKVPRRNTNVPELQRKVIFPKSSISNIKKRNQLFSKTNRVLLAITSTFLVLYLPISFFKIYSFISNEKLIESIHVSFNFSMTDEHFDHTRPVKTNDSYVNLPEILNVFSESSNKHLEMALFEKFASNMYYLNFITNFFLYNLVGTKYRKEFKNSLKRIKI